MNHIEDYEYGWYQMIAQKTPIVCYRAGSDEIVEVNWTFVSTKNDQLYEKIIIKKCRIEHKNISAVNNR